MAGVDDVPIIGLEAAERALKAKEAVSANVSPELGVWLRELKGSGPGAAREPSRREQIAAMTYDELLADRFLLDRLTRAVGLACDLDYLEALEKFRGWSEGGNPTVGQIFAKSPADLDDVCRDIVKMEAREVVQGPQVELLDSSDPDRQVSIGATDELGRILLPDEVDRARLLTDAYAIERAWLKVQDLDHRGAYARGVVDSAGLDGRQRFEREYRAHIEDGVDLVASLEATHRKEQVEQRETDEATKALAAADREEVERGDRAKRRKLEAQRAEIDAKLRET
jgi:hypothetical protein